MQNFCMYLAAALLLLGGHHAAAQLDKAQMVSLQTLGECGNKDGINSSISTCQTIGAFDEGQSLWYEVVVSPKDADFDMRYIVEAEGGQVLMGLWQPSASIADAPSYIMATLLTSAVTQESYIRVPAADVSTNTGSWHLQIKAVSGAPLVTVRLDLTPSKLTLDPADAKALAQVLADCCPHTEQGEGCMMLSAASAPNHAVTDDICHQGANNCNNANGRITELILRQEDLSGMGLTCEGFSAGFGALAELKRLDLSGNPINSNLAAVASGLNLPANPSLKWLVLRSTGLTGPLVCDIINEKMELISFSWNSVTGSIPECFTKSPSLLHLYLTGNKLTGPISDFTDTAPLQLLFAWQQQDEGGITGSVPSSIGGLANLKYVHLGANSLEGSIPVLSDTVRFLNLSNNHFSGSLPDLPKALLSADLQGNALTGSIPSDMTAFNLLSTLNVSHNSLEGPLPSYLPPNLRVLSAAGNTISGQMPVWPGSVRHLDVSNNVMEGAISAGPSEAGLVWADLSANGFTGELPAALSQAQNLLYLNVSTNKLTSIQSPKAWDTPSLVTLDLSDNEFTGPIPGNLGKTVGLYYINLSSNLFSETLEEFAANLQPQSNIGSVFDISHNEITGPLPEMLQNLAFFDPQQPSYPTTADSAADDKVFDVNYNSFNGPFPAFMVNTLPKAVDAACPVPVADPCPIHVGVGLGGGTLTCPEAITPNTDQLNTLKQISQFQMACQDETGSTFEVSSVLKGQPKQLDNPAPQKRAATSTSSTTQTAATDSTATTPVDSTGYSVAAAPLPDSAQQTAQATAPADEKPSDSSRPKLAIGAIAGIAVGSAVGLAILASLGYVVGYRRWWTVKTAREFKKMPEVTIQPINADGPISDTIPLDKALDKSNMV